MVQPAEMEEEWRIVELLSRRQKLYAQLDGDHVRNEAADLPPACTQLNSTHRRQSD